MRQVVLADHDLHIHPEIVRVAQDLDHAPHRARTLLRVFEQLHVHHHAVHLFHRRHARRFHPDAVGDSPRRRNLQPLGDLDPLLDAPIVGDHELPAAANPEFTHHGGVRALEHLDDFAVRAPARLDPPDAHHHPVAVHGLLRRFRRDEDVPRHPRRRLVGNQKAVAIAVHIQSPDGEFPAAGGYREVPRAQLDHLAARRQAPERRLQGRAFDALGPQFPRQLFEIGARVRQFAHVFQQGGVRHIPILPAAAMALRFPRRNPKGGKNSPTPHRLFLIDNRAGRGII